MAGGKHILGKAKRHIFGTARVGEKGQIVIPKEARQTTYGQSCEVRLKLGGQSCTAVLYFDEADADIRPGDTLLILGDEETGIIVTKPDVLRDAANEIFGKMEK